MSKLRLGVNIDHVATIRNARGGAHPDPVRAAFLAVQAGADGITAHLREDRRHISDADITALVERLTVPLNLEMAATPEMLDIALAHKPHAVCLVPEKREEVTTEGGLDVVGLFDDLKPYVERLGEAGSKVSLFIDPEIEQLEAAVALGAPVCELHTGAYCEADDAAKFAELDRIRKAAAAGVEFGLEMHAGHGLDFESVKPVAALTSLSELNIGHFLVGEAIFTGFERAIGRMRVLMADARGLT